jgi:hypothetical protein
VERDEDAEYPTPCGTLTRAPTLPTMLSLLLLLLVGRMVVLGEEEEGRRTVGEATLMISSRLSGLEQGCAGSHVRPATNCVKVSRRPSRWM